MQQVESVAKAILEKHKTQRLFKFIGEMGAGKTTLIKALCKQLGVQDEVTSPTFALVNEYACPKAKIYHFDFYRIDSEEEAEDMGVFEYFDSGDYCLLEWPEKIPGIIENEPFVEVIIQNHNGERDYKF